MTRECEECGFINQDDYDFCAKCGNPLIPGARRQTVYIARPEDIQINKKAVAAAYIITIFLSWIGFVVGMISKHTHLAVFTFFGFFMPFYLVQSKHPTLRKHGIIMMMISLVGVALSFYVMIH